MAKSISHSINVLFNMFVSFFLLMLYCDCALQRKDCKRQRKQSPYGSCGKTMILNTYSDSMNKKHVGEDIAGDHESQLLREQQQCKKPQNKE